VTPTLLAKQQALDKVGESDLELAVHPEIYPPDFLSQLDGQSSVVDGIVKIPASGTGWAAFRECSRTLLESRLRSL
jgi:hypothetical protein